MSACITWRAWISKRVTNSKGAKARAVVVSMPMGFRSARLCATTTGVVLLVALDCNLAPRSRLRVQNGAGLMGGGAARDYSGQVMAHMLARRT